MTATPEAEIAQAIPAYQSAFSDSPQRSAIIDVEEAKRRWLALNESLLTGDRDRRLCQPFWLFPCSA
jgi:hypothetical protein